MENRPEYLAITMGMAKIGVTIALLNTNIQENLLYHAILISKAKIIIVSNILKDHWDSCIPFFEDAKIQFPDPWIHGQCIFFFFQFILLIN